MSGDHQKSAGRIPWSAPVLRSLSAGRAAAGATVTYADESRHVFKYVAKYVGTSNYVSSRGPGSAVGPS